MWRPICDAPRNGDPFIVVDNDGSGEWRCAFPCVNGTSGWWECKSEEKPQTMPYTVPDDIGWAACWAPLPEGLLERAREFVIEQYGAEAIPKT